MKKKSAQGNEVEGTPGAKKAKNSTTESMTARQISTGIQSLIATEATEAPLDKSKQDDDISKERATVKSNVSISLDDMPGKSEPGTSEPPNTIPMIGGNTMETKVAAVSVKSANVPNNHKAPPESRSETPETPALGYPLDESTTSRDTSQRRGSIFGRVFKRGASKRSMDASQNDMDLSSSSAHSQGSRRRRGSLFGKAVQSARALIHRPSEKEGIADEVEKSEDKTNKAKVSEEARKSGTTSPSKLASVSQNLTKSAVGKAKENAKVALTSMDVERSPKAAKQRLSVTGSKTTTTNTKSTKAAQEKSTRDTNKADTAGNDTKSETAEALERTSSQRKPKKSNNEVRANGKAKVSVKSIPKTTLDVSVSKSPKSSPEVSLTDMVRGQIRAGIKPRPRASVMNFVPTAPKAADFVEDDYQESPLRLLDTYEDELTVEQLREKVTKLEEQLRETKEAETREVETVVWSGRVMVEQIAQKTPAQASVVPDDLSAMDEALRRNNEIIKYLKSENQKRREEQKKIKTNFFDLHHSTVRLEKQTEETLGYLEKLEDVYYQGELDKRKSLLRGLAACREGDVRLTEELERRSSYVAFEEAIRQLYEREMEKLLLSFDAKYGGTPLSDLLNDIAAGKYDERLESVIREDDSGNAE